MIKNAWHTIKVTNGRLLDVYTKKYGLQSDFQKVQKIQLNHPEIKTAFKQALSWTDIKAGETIYDIGVNNGFELTFVELQYKTIWPTLKIICIDFIKDVLLQAVNAFVLHPNNTFIQGDARTFSGTDVITNEDVIIEEGTVDVVIAITSLQSSSFSNDLDVFVNALITRLTPDGRLLIAVPDCHTLEGRLVYGLYDANTESINSKSAEEFCDKLTALMKKHGFTAKQTGTYYKFLVYSRS